MTRTIRRFASLGPASARRDDRGVLVVSGIICSGQDVRRGGYVERLAATPETWEPLPESVLVTDDHALSTGAATPGSARAIIGQAGGFRFALEGLRADEIRILDAHVAALIEGGIVKGLSIEAEILDAAESVEDGESVLTIHRARLTGLSLTTNPADRAAVIRSERHMPQTEPTAPDAATIARRGAIREIARSAGLDSAWADSQIDSGADETAARAAAFDAMTTRGRRPIIRAAAGFSHDDSAVMTRRAAEALAADAAGVPITDEGANRFRGMGFRGLARAALAGESGASYMSDAAAFDTVMTRSASHATADFPNALLGAGARIVAHAYGEAASPIERNLVVYGTAPDFRPVTEVGLSGLPNLQPISENGEIAHVTAAEAATSWKLGTYAAALNVSRQMLVNDDLNLFGQIAAELGRAARRTETSAIVALLADGAGAGPLMGDGVALFHASHGNVAASGAAVTEASLQAGLLAIQAQTGLGGEVIGLRANYLLVAPAQEIAARKVLAAVTPAKASDANPLAGVVDVLVDARLSGLRWYLFCAPASAPVLKVGRLAGQSGPVVQQQERWSGLGTSYRVFTDFGVTAVDHRGAYTNAGA